MKKPSYIRYKRYEREHGLVEWLIKTRPKLPRGRDGRPAKEDRAWLRGLVISYWDDIYSAWYGDNLDYDLCDALRTAFKQPKTMIGKEARMVVVDKLSNAFGKGDATFPHRLADCMNAVKKAPRYPLKVAVVVAHEILSRKGNKDPKQVEVVKTATEFFKAPDTIKEMESLNASLYREAKRHRNYLRFLEHEGENYEPDPY